MKIITADSAEYFENSPECRGYSLGRLNDDIDIAVVEVKGRYPRSGYLINEICREAVFIVSGTGELITEEQTISFSDGDAVYVDRNEKFAWKGDFKGIFTLAPAFDPTQHKEVRA